MTFIAYYKNASTGGSFEEKFNARAESSARAAALKLETKHRKLVRLEVAKSMSTKRTESAASREKRLINMMQQLQLDFGGSKYNKVSDELVVRIAEHCKNPQNDQRFNYDCKVISFVILVWGDQFKGQANEWDITDMTYSQAKKFIQSKIA